MPGKHRRYFLKAKESKTLLEKASEKLKVDLGHLFKNRAEFEVFETGSVEIFLIDGRPLLVRDGESVFPTLKFDEYFQSAPKVIVDMGAVPYVCKGANIMAPGIRGFVGQFSKNNIVFVVDEKHGKPIALGEILYDSDEVKHISHGVVVKNLYYVGDSTWNLIKELGLWKSED